MRLAALSGVAGGYLLGLRAAPPDQCDAGNNYQQGQVRGRDHVEMVWWLVSGWFCDSRGNLSFTRCNAIYGFFVVTTSSGCAGGRIRVGISAFRPVGVVLTETVAGHLYNGAGK